MDKRKFYLDLLERTLWTFVQAFAATVLITQELDSDSLYIALVAGVIAVLKGLLASQIGNPGSASMLPQSLEPKPPQFGARR